MTGGKSRFLTPPEFGGVRHDGAGFFALEANDEDGGPADFGGIIGFQRPTMRRMLVVGGASLGIHIWLFFRLAGYRELAFRVGLLFPHHHDTADLLEAGGAGFAVLAIAMVVAGVLFERLFSSLWHGTRESAE